MAPSTRSPLNMSPALDAKKKKKKTGWLNMFRVEPGSWVMLDENQNFVPLPKEKVLFTSPPRTTLTLQTPNSYPGKNPWNASSSGGVAFLTNQRVRLTFSLHLITQPLTPLQLVYLPTNPDPQLQSFMAPILHLQDTRISAPFFGPNVWQGLLKPVTGGGVPAQHPFVELKMTFREGGAFDFHSTFERIRDSLLQAVEQAHANGQEFNPANVHLDELPAYTEGAPQTGPPPQQPRSGAPSQSLAPEPPPVARPSSGGFQPPNEPPPGYEEAQSSGVRDQMEESIRRTS